MILEPWLFSSKPKYDKDYLTGFDKLCENMQNGIRLIFLLYFTSLNGLLLILRVYFEDQFTNYTLDYRRDQCPCFSLYPHAGAAGEREVDD